MKLGVAFLSMLLAVGFAPSADAGIYSDDLAKCLVSATSDTDRTDLILWIYASMGAHPAVKTYSTITDAQRDVLTKRAGGLFTRLLTADCRVQTVAALKNEGITALGEAFNVFGQVAMQGLMREPNVKHEIGKLEGALDSNKIQGMFKEAGISASGTPEK